MIGPSRELQARRAALAIYIGHVTYFFSQELLVPELFAVLCAETSEALVGAKRAMEVLYECYQSEAGGKPVSFDELCFLDGFMLEPTYANIDEFWYSQPRGAVANPHNTCVGYRHPNRGGGRSARHGAGPPSSDNASPPMDAAGDINRRRNEKHPSSGSHPTAASDAT